MRMVAVRSQVCLLFALLSCASSCRVGTPPDCVTHCGIDIFQAKYRCEEYQFAEDETLREFLFTNDKRLHTCAVNDWRVEVQPTINFQSYGEQVSGRTVCESKVMYVNSHLPNRSSWSHEMAHAMQNCDPLRPLDSSDYYHSNWADGGIYAAISRVRAAR